MITKTYEVTTYVIAHNEPETIHPVIVEPGTVFSTGQPFLEEFETEEEWKARLTEFGYDIALLEDPTPAPETP